MCSVGWAGVTLCCPAAPRPSGFQKTSQNGQKEIVGGKSTHGGIFLHLFFILPLPPPHWEHLSEANRLQSHRRLVKGVAAFDVNL